MEIILNLKPVDSKNKSVNLKLSRAKFLEMFGLLGMESTSYICERMFDCIDSSKNQWISLGKLSRRC